MSQTFTKALTEYAWPHRRALLGGAAFILAETAVSLAVPWFGGRFANDLLGGNRPSMHTVLLLLAALFTVQGALRVAGAYVFSKRAALILADMRTRLYDHIQALPLSFFQQRQQGAILSVLSNDVAVLSGYMSGTLVSIIPMLVTIAGSVVFMLSIDVSMALIATAAIPMFYVLLKLFGRGIRPLSREVQEAHAQAFVVEEENLSMLPAIKTFTREEVESKRYRDRVAEIVRLTLKQEWIESSLGPGVQWIAALGVLTILWFAGERLNAGQLGAGAIVSFLLYTTLLTRPVGALADAYSRTQHARASVERLQAVLAEPTERYVGARVLSAPDGRVDFLNVSFAYPNRPPVLQQFSLSVAARETVAITGENGAGKTTLVSLLMRLIEPQGGQILIDGVDIATVDLRSLRAQVAVVPQNVYLFNGTVRDNIGYGLPGASDDAVIHAAEVAQAHEFVTQLPNGYDTVIGDAGVRLSGGQRQRIALARALLKDPRILILDEATAMFDPEAERHFLEDCRDVLRSRTVLLITHRPASLALADRVVRLLSGNAGSRPILEIESVSRG